MSITRACAALKSRAMLRKFCSKRVAVLRGDALGMELHAVHGSVLCCRPMISPSSVVRGDFERRGQVSALDDQRVVARRLEAGIEAAEQPLPVWWILLVLPCIRLGRAHDVAAHGLADGLVARGRRRGSGMSPRSGRSAQADAGLIGRAGPGESTIASGAIAAISSSVILSLRMHVDLGAQLAEEMDEVVGKAVVVIDDEEFWRIFQGPSVMVPPPARYPSSGMVSEANASGSVSGAGQDWQCVQRSASRPALLAGDSVAPPRRR